MYNLLEIIILTLAPFAFLAGGAMLVFWSIRRYCRVLNGLHPH